MIIGIDCSPLNRARKTGTEYYLENLVWALINLDTPHRFWLYSRRPLRGRFRQLPKRARNKILFWFPYLWTQLRLAGEMIIKKPDLLFVPAHTLPVICPVRAVTTIHDLAYEYFPASYTAFQRWHLRYTTRRAVKQAAKIIAVSDCTKKDLIKFYQANSNRIAVVPHGVDARFQVTPSPAQTQAVRKKYLGGWAGDFIIFVGRREERKNLNVLIRASQRLITQYHLPVRLVLAGGAGFGAAVLDRLIGKLNLEDKVYKTGYVAEADLPILLATAKIFAYPSHYEGFGLPVLEAMAARVPVVCADQAALYEVAGPAAWYVTSSDLAGWTESLFRVWTSAKIRKQMIINGLDRVKQFNWPKTAKKTLAVLETLK